MTLYTDNVIHLPAIITHPVAKRKGALKGREEKNTAALRRLSP